jgi:ZIP family zinc transporter
MESARVVVPYHWTPTWDFEAVLVLSGGATIHHTVIAPQQTPPVGDVLGTLALVGLFVGVIPVALGMLWFPFMRSMSERWLHAVLAFFAGVLAFLAVDAGIEAVEVAESIPGAFEGAALVVLAAVGTYLLVAATAGGEASGLRLAYLVALGVGLRNLAEGLAIGGAFALGRVSLGAFLVVGFMVHNVTEGPAVVAPVARGERPALRHFLALGVIAGAPVILGGWVGALARDPTLGALFLAVGVGAILQVVSEIAGMIRADGGRLGSRHVLLAGLAGLAVMYLTDLLVAL